MTSYDCDFSGLKCILLCEEGWFCKWDACESCNSLSVSTKNAAEKVRIDRIEIKQRFNHLITCPNWWLCECSSCFGIESPTYDDAKEPLNNWRSNLNALCSLPDMLVRITFHAKSYVTAVWPCESFDNLWQKRAWTWLSRKCCTTTERTIWIPFLGDAMVEQQRIFRCHSTQPRAWLPF